MTVKRRDFLRGAAAGGAIGVLDWLGWFRRFGVPGTSKTLGIAEAVAQQTLATPKFLIYWFQEGGWDSYSMFAPLLTANDAATLSYTNGQLNPSPAWSSQIYRPKNYLNDPVHFGINTSGNITYGFLAQDGVSLFPDMAVVSSHKGNTFHSGGRWDYHYGKYANYAALSSMRGSDERTVLQAFCEQYGSGLPLAHVAWCRWLSDGELSETDYPDGTGYYENLGPAYAHTQYGKTPAEMRQRLQSMSGVTAGARGARIRTFVDDLHNNFVNGKNGPAVVAFNSAVQIHRQLTGSQVVINPATLFTDPQLRADFGVTANDEVTTATSVNGNPARSKDSPNTNVQALMTYELMTKGLSCGFHIESREVRGFDSHRDRQSILNNKGQTDQLSDMKDNLWTPLTALVNKLKTTPYGTGGQTYWDLTTIVLCSEMGRTIQGDVTSILTGTDDDATKYQKVMEQDCCQHWGVNSVVFMGGNVKGNTQWGKVGSSSLAGIPMMPDGSLDPAYDSATGLLKSGQSQSPNSFISDAGHVYSTALYLTGLDPAQLLANGQGRNNRPPMAFIKK